MKSRKYFIAIENRRTDLLSISWSAVNPHSPLGESNCMNLCLLDASMCRGVAQVSRDQLEMVTTLSALDVRATA